MNTTSGEMLMQDLVFWIILGAVLLWLLFVLVFIIVLARRYTFGNWTPENPNPYEDETLAMPRGVMRGTLTLSLLFIVMLLEVVTLQISTLEMQIEQLLIAFQMMLAFYFGSKVMSQVTNADERKATETARALSQAGTVVVKDE